MGDSSLLQPLPRDNYRVTPLYQLTLHHYLRISRTQMILAVCLLLIWVRAFILSDASLYRPIRCVCKQYKWVCRWCHNWSTFVWLLKVLSIGMCQSRNCAAGWKVPHCARLCQKQLTAIWKMCLLLLFFILWALLLRVWAEKEASNEAFSEMAHVASFFFFSIREPYFISLIQHIEDIFITCRSTGTRIKYTISGKEKLSAVIKSSFHFDETWKWDKMVHGAVLEKISLGLKKKSGDSYSWNWNVKKITL